MNLNPFAALREPTAEQIRERQLRDATANLAVHAAKAEYHLAMAGMLSQRITRLQSEQRSA